MVKPGRMCSTLLPLGPPPASPPLPPLSPPPFAMMHHLSALLIQAREPGDPILAHELECFLRQSGLSPDQFVTLNLPQASCYRPALKRADVVFVGGSGDFSVVVGGFPWHAMLLEVMREVVARKTPMFASCFGFQALIQALGGTLVREPACAELGTHPIALTPQGIEDAIFGALPRKFDAQLGHHDSACVLPASLIPLASSQRCAIQAVAHLEAPIWATQFHPELTDRDNITRYLRYIQAYKAPEDSMDHARQKARQMHRPSPQANTLIPGFLTHCFAPPRHG